MSIQLQTPQEMLDRWQGIDCTCDPSVNHLCEVCHDIQVVRDLLASGSRLVGYILSVRRNNTEEWMEGLADELNQWAKATGEHDRVATRRDGLQVITPEDMEETLPD